MGVTTTHDPRGGGRPRLIFAFGGSIQTLDDQREFDLRPGVTTIGCGDEAHLQLPGLDWQHGEIRRDSADEYRYVQLSRAVGSSIDGCPMGSTLLRTGKRLQLGPWTLSYYREEFADHGRPYGGRVGGNNGYQRPQTTPRLRGTSPSGGCDRSDGEYGEYF